MRTDNLAVILGLTKDSVAGEECCIAALEGRSTKIGGFGVLDTRVGDELSESSVDILVGGGKLIGLPWVEAASDCWSGSRSVGEVLEITARNGGWFGLGSRVWV